MKCLDLFCGAGGASIGLHRAGFEVHGVDLNAQAEYPFEFTQADALKWDNWDCDLIWASPPRQGYSIGGNNTSRLKYPKLIEPVRKMLEATGKPFIIENVPGAPLRKDLLLCGEMFGLKVIRHRIFEVHGFKVSQPEHKKHNGTVSDGQYIMACRGGRPGCFGNKGKRNKLKAPTALDIQKAMGISHISDFGMICEAIPPAYSEYIANQFKEGVKR